ncbi:MAG: hypothetical protein GX490_02540 [Bacilli bacterium]|nr:hypothetical protein [Bacilli bacterium]
MIINIVYLVANISINLALYLKFGYSDISTKAQEMQENATNIVSIIIWFLIFAMLKANNKNSENILHALLTILLVINIFFFTKDLILNLINFFVYKEYLTRYIVDILLNQFIRLVPALIIIVCLYLVIKSGYQLYNNNNLILFRKIALILVAVNSVIILYKFIKFLNNYQLINDITAYLTFNTLIDIIIMLINPIVWILFINAFIKNYIGYEINNDNHVNEDINSCNKSLNNVFGNYGLFVTIIINAIKGISTDHGNF